MGEIYVSEADEEANKETPAFIRDFKRSEPALPALSVIQPKRSLRIRHLQHCCTGIIGEQQERSPLREVIRCQFTPLITYALITFVFLYIPYVGVAIAIKREFGTWKWFGIAFACQMVLAWTVAFVICQGGRLLG